MWIAWAYQRSTAPCGMGGAWERPPPKGTATYTGTKHAGFVTPMLCSGTSVGGQQGDGRALLMAGGCGCGTGRGVTKGRDNGPQGAAAQSGG